MVDMQKHFTNFHDEIKLDYEDNSLLRDYRDQVISGLEDHLDIDHSFSHFLQGSYAMHTGIKSIDENIDFDIDIALSIDMKREDCINPVTSKKWVKEAMEKVFPSAEIKIKKPCVTISFAGDSNDENVHVDIAIYADEDGNYFLAKGKEFSSKENRCWEEADPKELKDKITNSYADVDDRKQFRRCIRYLKRWKDEKFNQENRPNGIGITVSALESFYPYSVTDAFSGKKTYNDLDALDNFVKNMLNSFSETYNFEEDTWYSRLKVYLPVKPRTDIYEQMTDKQMNDFKDKLKNLSEDLEYAKNTLDEHEATKRMNKHFGDDFIIVSEEEVVSKAESNAFVSDYPSA